MYYTYYVYYLHQILLTAENVELGDSLGTANF